MTKTMTEQDARTTIRHYDDAPGVHSQYWLDAMGHPAAVTLSIMDPRYGTCVVRRITALQTADEASRTIAEMRREIKSLAKTERARRAVERELDQE